MPVTPYLPESLTAETRDRFAAARHTGHRTMFERALPMFEQLVEIAPGAALPLAWLAYVRRMLFHDVGVELAQAGRLAERIAGAERAMVELIAAQARGDLHSGLARADEFLALRPDDPYGRHKQAVFLLDLDRPAEAARALERLLVDEPELTFALNHLGFAHVALGDRERGMAVLRRFVDAEPDNYSARDSLADALAASGDPLAAVTELEAAVAIEPAFAYGWRHLGDLRAELGDINGAQAAYRSAADNAELYGSAFIESLQPRLERS